MRKIIAECTLYYLSDGCRLLDVVETISNEVGFKAKGISALVNYNFLKQDLRVMISSSPPVCC